MKNKITSSKTSRNQLAGGFKKVDWDDITHNFDIGGGKYDKGIEWLKEKRVKNLVFDPYNRSTEFNNTSLYNSQFAQSSTIFNVLNVVPDKEMRSDILTFARRLNTKKIFITVYERNRSGEGEKTRDGWQANRTLSSFLPEVKEIYPSAVVKNKMIVVEV